MNYQGIILGLAAFLCIGFFHPIVIKCEYHFGVKCWPLFLIVGIAGCTGSLFVENVYASVLLGVFSFSCFWSILELFEQRERVRKGWFPNNPKRKKIGVYVLFTGSVIQRGTLQRKRRSMPR